MHTVITHNFQNHQDQLQTAKLLRQLIDTPNIDRIAAEGMLFRRCLVSNSICGPSRATVLTGKYSHLNGFYNNSNSRFDGSQVTFPKLLQAAGYQTAVVGKWHLVSDPTGFDYWHILPGQGAYYNPPMIDNGRQVKHEGYTTDIITELSLEWLKNRDPAKPFLLMCQHKAPHREWEPALRHLGHDRDRDYPEPATLFDDYAGRGLAERDQDMTIARTMTPRDVKLIAPANLTPEQRAAWDVYYEPRNQKFREANLSGRDLVRWKYQRYLHDYLGCIKAVDESVGRLLRYLVLRSHLQHLAATGVARSKDFAQREDQPLPAIETQQHTHRAADFRFLNQKRHIDGHGFRIRQVPIGRVVDGRAIACKRQ